MSSSGETTVTEPAVSTPVAVLAWLWVVVPFGYGLYDLLQRIPALFGS